VSAASRASLAGPRLSAEARARRQSGKLNILYFSPFPSHPANHGNQWAIQQSGKRFQSLGHKVHFALLESGMYDAEAERLMRQTWDSFHILPNTKQLWANGSEIPFDGWYEDGLGDEVRVLCDIYDIDVVFCSYVFQSKLLEHIPEQILKVIDTHDKMGGRYDMLRRNGQPREFFSCSLDEEGAYLRRADVVVARREEEARYFDSVTGRNSAIVIPHVEEPLFVDKPFDRLEKVGLVASANRINLSMTLDFLETLARQGDAGPPFTVHIAGEVRDLVKSLSPQQAGVFDLRWVRMLGFVPDIGTFYRDMDAIVSPVTMGTGMNVKTIQAMAFGMPLVTTSCGARGIETKEPMHNHRDMESLVQGLLQLAKSLEELDLLAEASRKRYSTFYRDASRNMQVMLDQAKLI
jgi:glycosyltransferase involved in cell wall biosynthesis